MRKNCSFIFGVDLRPCALAVQLVAALAVLFVHAVPASAQNPPVTIAVDANANRLILIGHFAKAFGQLKR